MVYKSMVFILVYFLNFCVIVFNSVNLVVREFVNVVFFFIFVRRRSREGVGGWES